MNPSVSIITVTYNSKSYLEQFLPSILLTKGDFEFIIFDNNSNDGSSEYIQQNFPQVRLIQNKENLGFAKGNNVAAQKSKADLLVFINPDTLVEPEWLENLIKPFNSSDIGLTTSKILLMHDKNTINTCGNAIHISGITQCRGVNEPSSNYTVQDEVSAISGAAFAIRRELFDKLNGFDTDFFLYMEETDLSLRARGMGWKCIYVPDSIVYHDYELRFGPKKVFYQERNRHLMLLQNFKWITIFLMLPILFLAEIITWGFVILRDRKNFSNKIDAYCWIIKNWRMVMTKRKNVQALRSVPDKDLLAYTTFNINFDQVTSGALNLFLSVFNGLYWIMKQCLMLLLRLFNI